MTPRSIASLNKLPREEKRAIYQRIVPPKLLERFGISADLTNAAGTDLADFSFNAGSTDVVLELRHHPDAVDPILYAHMTDTMNGQVHVLLYILNDPDSERFDVDRMPDGRPTKFGLELRNIPAEIAAMGAGLAPGQVRRGLRMLQHAIPVFEQFIEVIGQSLYFMEPLYYHNAVIFERYGFSYSQGRRLMEEFQADFLPAGAYAARLDGSTPFREPEYADSIRGRSWAIHDGIANAPFSGVTMFKRLGSLATIDTFPGGRW